MRGSFPLELTIQEKTQLIAWSHSEPPNSLKARNARIILRLTNGSLISQIAEEQGLCRQTVSEVRRCFLIFGLDGINRCHTRLGRKPSIRGEKAIAVLKISVSEAPFKGYRWTGQQLARRCELPSTTIYRFLKRHGISLDDPRTINDAIDGVKAHILGVAGLFLSSSISVLAFWCNTSRNPIITGPSSIVTRPQMGNVSAFFSRETERLLKHIEEIRGELLMMKPKRTDYTDILMFMDILDERTRGQREVLLVADSTDLIVGSRLMRWLEGHPRFHLATSQRCERWTVELREHLNPVSEGDKRTIALQLEHLNNRLGEWRNGPFMNLGVCSSMNPLG